jgi:tetratricopeptide (TPR) repeat protein
MAMAAMLRKQNRPGEAARQYDTLLLSARDAGAQLSVATQYLAVLHKGPGIENSDPAGIAQLMSRLAREAWSFESAQSVLAEFARVLVFTGLIPDSLQTSLVAGVSTSLRTLSEPSAVLARAQLHYALERTARAIAALPDAKPSADKLLRESRALASASDESLKSLTNAADKILAARAAALLGERALASNDLETGTQLISTALSYEPNSADLRAALARVYIARNTRDKAVTSRDDLLRALPLSADNLRRAAVLSHQAGRNEDAERFASQALGIAQTSPAVSVGEAEEIALLAARAIYETGNASGATTRAIEIWNGLTSPQFTLVTRLAALLDLEAHLRDGNKTDAADGIKKQIDALQPNDRDLARAQNYLNGLW